MNLGAYAIGVQLSSVDKVTSISGEIACIATLGIGDANGLTLQEAGLFTRGSAATAHPIGVSVNCDAPDMRPGYPRMIARQTHPPIPKTAAISIEYQWRISFAA